MKVKILSFGKESTLQEEVNKFLETIEPQREGAGSIVVDIKYQVCTGNLQSQQSGMDEGSYEIHSAMVIYK